jgi:CRISPR/Cas system CMR subunit Cmr4 (Cas7 group RAMP superfamily)
MVLIVRSVETSRSPSIAARSLAGPTSGRSYRRVDLEEASNQRCQYPRIPSRILKGVLHEEVVDDVVAEVAMSGVGRW